MAKGKGSSSFTQFNEIMDQVKAGELSVAYLLHGEEYYFLEKLLQEIEEVGLDETTKSFNHHVFYGKDANVLDIVNVARRYPMMAEKQVIVVKEAQHLRNPELIIPYLENPIPSTVLVWYHPGKNLPLNRKLGAAFKKAHTVYTAEPVSEKEVVHVVSKYIAEQGYDIEPRPLHLLVENCGGKFSTIVSELEKVFSNLEKGNKIREDHIQRFVGINKDYNIFALQRALAKKDKALVIEIMHYFSSNMANFPLVMLNATLFSYFRKVAIMQSMTRSTDKEVMSALGIPFFAISEYRQAANNYRGMAMRHVLDAINDCDLKFKGIKDNTGDDSALLNETVLKILSA